MTLLPSTLTVHVVPHTHWDREWYHTAERFRQRLVALVDEVLDEPPPAGTSFLLDGQSILLDDYLEVRPERAAELACLLRDGRLEAGPWYVLADELIPGGEALVRNLLAGRDVLRRHGAEAPPVLYCPDSFGHPAILPELAAGFGCELVILWRGYGGARWPAGDTVQWRGPSGQRVVLYHLPPDGYEFGSTLPVGPAAAAARWASSAAVLRPRARTGVTLLLNGADHHARQRGQAAAVHALARAATPDVVRPSTLRAAANAILGAAHGRELPEVAGELRDSYGYTWTLAGTLGTRAAQKRRNARAERLLVRDVEPWLALGTSSRDAGARALLGAAWRSLLRGHPHDTLCGTSTDAVADTLDRRIASAEVQGRALRHDGLLHLLAHGEDDARHRSAEWRPAIVLRNPAPRPRAGVAELTLATTLADVAVGPGSASRQGEVREPEADWVAQLGAQPVSRRRTVSLTEAPRAYPDADLVEEARALAWAEVEGGYQLRTMFRCDPLPPGVEPVRVTKTSLDNGLVRVAVSATGEVSLTDSVAGLLVESCCGLELARDDGDSYTPSIREPLEPMRYEGCHRVHRGPLRGELALEFRDASGPGALTLRLQLDAGLAAARIAVDGWFARRDARLRLRVGTAVTRDAMTVADAAFHPATRGVLVVGADDARMERVVPTAPLHRYVSRYGAARGATVFSDGLAEYESLATGEVAITLVRAIGALSRHDLPERPGHAGWPNATPASQSSGPYAARLAVALHGADSPAQRAAIERLADDILLPITGTTLRSNLEGERVAGGLELEGDGLAFSAALPARAAGWIVLRCVNRRDSVVHGLWRLARPVLEARVARLDESPGEMLPVAGGTIRFGAAPMAIVTVLARLG